MEGSPLGCPTVLAVFRNSTAEGGGPAAVPGRTLWSEVCYADFDAYAVSGACFDSYLIMLFVLAALLLLFGCLRDPELQSRRSCIACSRKYLSGARAATLVITTFVVFVAASELRGCLRDAPSENTDAAVELFSKQMRADTECPWGSNSVFTDFATASFTMTRVSAEFVAFGGIRRDVCTPPGGSFDSEWGASHNVSTRDVCTPPCADSSLDIAAVHNLGCQSRNLPMDFGNAHLTNPGDHVFSSFANECIAADEVFALEGSPAQTAQDEDATDENVETPRRFALALAAVHSACDIVDYPDILGSYPPDSVQDVCVIAKNLDVLGDFPTVSEHEVRAATANMTSLAGIFIAALRDVFAIVENSDVLGSFHMESMQDVCAIEENQNVSSYLPVESDQQELDLPYPYRGFVVLGLLMIMTSGYSMLCLWGFLSRSHETHSRLLPSSRKPGPSCSAYFKAALPSTASMRTFEDCLVLQLRDGRSATHRDFRNVTATHLRSWADSLLGRQRRRLKPHGKTVSKLAWIWRNRPRPSRTFGDSASAKGVQPEHLASFCETLVDAFHTEISNGDTAPVRTGHVLGDGNCGWRAAYKALPLHLREQRSLFSWRTLKKRCLNCALANANLDAKDRTQLRTMRSYGTWSNSATFICLAHYLRLGVLVHSEATCWCFRPMGDSGDLEMHLSLTREHCSPAWTNDVQPAGGHKVRDVCSPPVLLVGVSDSPSASLASAAHHSTYDLENVSISPGNPYIVTEPDVPHLSAGLWDVCSPPRILAGAVATSCASKPDLDHEPPRRPRPKRKRTQRVMIEIGETQTPIFAPCDWSKQRLEEEIARAMGVRRAWLAMTWHGRNLNVRITRDRALLPEEAYRHLWTLAASLPAGQSRETLRTAALQSEQKEQKIPAPATLVFGAKATRKHGLTKATSLYRDTLVQINALLTAHLPDEHWQSLAVVTHSDIHAHQDLMDDGIAYMLSLSRAAVRLKVATEISGLPESFAVHRQFAYFNPRATHSAVVEAAQPVISLVLYSPARWVSLHWVQELLTLGFPATKPLPRYIPAAQPFEIADDDTDDATDEEDQPSATTAYTNTEDACLPLSTLMLDMERNHEPPPLARTPSPISPTLPWHDGEDELLAGASDSPTSEDTSKLTQWTKGMKSGHSPKQLRVILSAEQRTCRRLHECHTNGERSKAESIILAAMKRCGMLPAKPQSQPQSQQPPQQQQPNHSQQVPQQPNQQPQPQRQQQQQPQQRATSRRQRKQNSEANKPKETSGTQNPPQNRASGTDRPRPPNQQARNSSSQPSNAKEEEPKSSFALLSEDWPAEMPPRTEWAPDTAGVFLTESTEAVTKWGQQCKFSKKPVLAVSPARPPLEGYPISKRVIRFKETRAGHPDRVVHMHGFVTQLTYAPIPAYQSAQEVVIQCTRSSVVIRGHIPVKELDQDRISRLTSTKRGAPMTALAELLPSKARPHLLDVWGVRLNESSSCYNFLCRVTESKTEAFLSTSGSGCIWLDTPSTYKDKEEIQITWMKERASDGRLTEAMDRAAIDSILRQHSNHLGLIKGRNGEIAVRARAETTRALRSELGQFSEKLYRVTDLPIHLEASDVAEILSQIQWSATLMPFSKTCRRHHATWNVRAAQPPEAMAYPLSIGYERFSMRVIDPAISKPSSRPTAQEPKPSGEFTGSVSWCDALLGRHKPPQPLPSQQQGGRSTQSSQGPAQEEASRYRWDESKRENCEMFDLERPPKKARSAKPRRSDDDADEAGGGDPREEADMDLGDGASADDDDEHESDAASVRDESWSQASYGFGSDQEDEQHELDKRMEEPSNVGRRAALGAKPKRLARQQEAEVHPHIAQEFIAHSNRITGLEAGLGRMENMLATLISQSQQQQQQLQQQLLQQVQAVVQQHIPQAAEVAAPSF
eukprot:3306531-Amphidinium_carterae.1